MRVAILEDDEAHINYITHILSKIQIGEETTNCTSFSSGKRLRSELRHETYDLLIMNWASPDMDGIELLKWLRAFQKSDIPAIMLTARNSESDIAKALEAGADEFMTKPVRPIEFRARVMRLMERCGRSTSSSTLNFGRWVFDRSTTTARSVGNDIEHKVLLTEREFRLAVALFQHLGSPLSRSHLLEYSGVSGDEIESRALDSHIYRLRGKLFLPDKHGIRLNTVYGYGYRLELLG